MTQLFFSEYDQPEAARPLVIVGAGGLGREVAVLVRQLNEAGAAPGWDLRGFYDDAAPRQASIAGLPYLGTSADLNATAQPLHVALAVGGSASRRALRARLTSPLLHFPVLVHPAVALESYQQVSLGEGCIIQQGCILTTDISLGRFVLLNLGCTIGHDAVLEDFCSLMPHANVGGAAHLAAGVYLGTNATVIQGVQVGADSIVGAGAVAVRDLPGGITAVGVPARALAN
ncbi:acetyltransferase [Hymenobacter saemangeumensis]|uniref:Acetyltransferase n=1 Tax=Hymenobacter saemangeumensis TaxID=1084522 RepID=A0ABP8I9B4_9BACT